MVVPTHNVFVFLEENSLGKVHKLTHYLKVKYVESQKGFHDALKTEHSAVGRDGEDQYS